MFHHDCISGCCTSDIGFLVLLLDIAWPQAAAALLLLLQLLLQLLSGITVMPGGGAMFHLGHSLDRLGRLLLLLLRT